VPKKSITLPAHVLKVVDEEVNKNYNGSLSSYILELLKEDKQQEINKAYDEMPIRVSESKDAAIENRCLYCGKMISIGSRICNAKFKDEHCQYVHEKCCRD
jgi:Arc/MetJ-type ribon-helix-helix transcriptional regulator